MMREIITKVYQFHELSDEAKEKAVEKLYYINVEYYDWWDQVYDDAAEIGLKITEFDDYVLKGQFTEWEIDVANKIIENHGEHCDTYRTAQDYLVERRRLVAEQCQNEADEICISFDYIDGIFDVGTDELDTEDIDREFLRSLCEDYRIILQKEYEWLTSEEAIRATIENGDWEFTEKGGLW
jgi:hypothetical protein